MTYDELWAEFRTDSDDGFPGSFTDWMVIRLETWEKLALAEVHNLRRRLGQAQNAPTVPDERYRAVVRELEAVQNQLLFERSQHAATPNLGYAREATTGTTAPPPGVAPDPLRRPDQIRQQGRDLRAGVIDQEELDRVVRRLLSHPDDTGES